MQIDLYSQSGDKIGEIDVSDKIFGAKVNHTLIHQALLRELSNKRNPIAYTKTKGEVRGGGKKPWKQKHTGRARQGSRRNPHFIGGGVAFGPRGNQNFTLAMPRQQRRAALFSALSAKANDHEIFALERYESEAPKTKLFMNLLKKLPVKKNLLMVLHEKNVPLEKSARNLPNVKTVLRNELTLHDILRYKKIVFLKDALASLK